MLAPIDCLPEMPAPNDRRRHPTIAESFAMDAASNMPPCMYRSGYDTSLPLVPKKHFFALAEITPWDRAFFLTFKVHGRAATNVVSSPSCRDPLLL